MRGRKSQIIATIENIYRVNLGVKRSDRVLVFTDGYTRPLRNISRLVADTGAKFTERLQYIEYPPTNCHGIEPPEEIWARAFGHPVVEELRRRGLISRLIEKRISDYELDTVERVINDHRKEAVSVVIALSYFSTSHTRFRSLLNKICKTRYASMPLFDEKMLLGPMRVDWKAMNKRINEIAGIMRRYNYIHITTPNGTDILLERGDREVKKDTGIITSPGSFSNLPAGEVFFAPMEGKARGKLVLEWAPTRKLNSPITLEIEGGMVVNIKGKDKYASFLKEKISERKENGNIAELGIGTNDKASRPDNILESEKIYGTIHIALGDNSSFGGTVSTTFHQDFVFFKPTIELYNSEKKKRVLLKDGKLIKK
jgi:leucyl aminopeptidase (aminopeptidase T)